jgi:predicted phage terminase large subunit-like protein
MNQELTRRELAIIRAKCDKDLLFFTRFWYKTIHGTKFIVNWHHEEIRDCLKQIENYELDLLNINIPPRFSKTELAAVNFIARGIGMNPTSNWLYITASDELRSQTSVSIRDIVSHPYFKIMYGVELKKDQNSKNLWRTNHGGGLKTATIFGQVTGFGAGQMIEHNTDLLDYVREFEGAIVLDDINKTDDSEVENANNTKVSRTLFNTVMSRKNSKDTPLVNIQQRAGHTDVTGQLMEHYEDDPRAKFLVLPVIIDGVPLWEWKHDLKDIEKLRTSDKTAHIFGTQYMQVPYVDKEGLVFAADDLNYFDPKHLDLSKADGICSFIDIADTGDDDHSAPIGYLIDDFIYVTDVYYTKEGTKTNVQGTADILNKHDVNYVNAESNFGGSMYVQLISPILKEDIVIQGVRAQGNKHSRILTAEMPIKKRFRFIKNFDVNTQYGRFMKCLVDYQRDGKSKHDDAPDSLHGLYKLFKNFYGLWGD